MKRASEEIAAEVVRVLERMAEDPERFSTKSLGAAIEQAARIIRADHLGTAKLSERPETACDGQGSIEDHL